MMQILCSPCSSFECDSHTVHMLTPRSLLPPLTSTVKSSLFTHVHYSSLFLAARLHYCYANCSHYINNGCTFSGQTLYKQTNNCPNTSLYINSWISYKSMKWHVYQAQLNLLYFPFFLYIAVYLTLFNNNKISFLYFNTACSDYQFNFLKTWN